MKHSAVVVTVVIAAAMAGCAQGAQNAPSAGDFSIVVLPDTQIYAMSFPQTFHAQTQWVAQNAAKMNTRFVLQVGDATNDNNDAQWAVAAAAFGRLDTAKVPYAICLGNHDTGRKGYSTDRSSLMGKYFPLGKWKASPAFAGVYDKEPDRPDNSYHTFAAGGRKWLVLALEFAPRDDVLRWAGGVAAAHKDHRVIVITHAYLYNDGTRYDRKVGKQAFGLGGYGVGKTGNDGQQIWEKLVYPNENIRLVVCGHIWTTARRVDANKAGLAVHQMVVDYQTHPQGGQGYLRVMKFSEGGEVAEVYDYSPTLGKNSPEPGGNFRIDFRTTVPAAAAQTRPSK